MSTTTQDADDGADWSSDIEDHSPSCKLVFKTLQYEGALTQQEVAEETWLPSRTARYALTRLVDAGILEASVYLPDARKRQYAVADAAGGESA